MIKRSENMQSSIKPNMRGGDGQATVTEIVSQGDYAGKARLVATITLKPGCSIGEHVHENEEEIFYIIKGVAKYFDDGKYETLYEGDSCVCSGGRSHSIANAGETDDLVIFAVILTY